MRLFLAMFLLLLSIVLPVVYFPNVRRFVRRYWLKLAVTVFATASVLFALFVAMATSTWRIF
jgi:hypothetical protein